MGSGESVEDRWNREFISIEQKKRAKEIAAAKKDVRDQEIKQEMEEQKKKSERLVTVLPEEPTPYKLDSEDYVRIAWIKVTRLLETIGILTPADRYTVVDGDGDGDNSELVSDSDSRR